MPSDLSGGPFDYTFENNPGVLEYNLYDNVAQGDGYAYEKQPPSVLVVSYPVVHDNGVYQTV